LIQYIIVSTVIGLIFAIFMSIYVIKQPVGSKRMLEISNNIHNGTMIFIQKEYFILSIFVMVVSIILFNYINPLTGLAFIMGALFSSLAGFIGIFIATKANVRTAQAAKKGINNALRFAFNSGTVMSMTTVSLALLGISIMYVLFHDTQIIFGFAFGASSIAMFARVGGGIFTKSADIGADLVGKIEKGMPEDDARNPAVIADNVGDNVGDVAGMGADLFESYVSSLIAAMAIGLLFFGEVGLLFTLELAAIGIIASIIGTFFVRSKHSPERAFRNGIWMSSFLVAVSSYFLSIYYFGNLNIFYSIIIGLATGLLIAWNTERYTSADQKYVKSIVIAAKTGAASTIIKGLVVGMRSTKNSMILIAFTIFFAYQVGGIYGIAIASVAMLSTLGISLAIDAFGPIVDNAGGIAQMAHMPSSVRKITDRLDEAGNTTAAMGKGFAIASAALTALVLFSSFSTSAGLKVINIIEPRILMGLFIGAMLPFFFSALTMNSVAKGSLKMLAEVRRQFKNKKLLQGKIKPDYNKCIEISTEVALKEMLLPGLVIVIAPILTGILFGTGALGGLLAGSLISGVAMSIMLSNAGGAWDNAKKTVEAMPAQKSKAWKDLHEATVIGDTVGDPFKDTSGPALNILIKLMSIVSLVFLPLFQNPIF